MWERTLDGDAGTTACAHQLAELLGPGDVLLLEGPLGAGKTTLVRGLVAAVGGEPEAVSSPTFTLLHSYPGTVPVIHVDAYRLAEADELLALGFDDLRSDAIACVEWASRVAEAFDTESCWRLELQHVSPERRAASLQPPAQQLDKTTMPAPWRRSTAS